MSNQPTDPPVDPPTVPARPWFVGAWLRRSIEVPGAAPTEPSQAWWLQTEHAFVDVRVPLPGNEHTTLPFSSARAFAGRFEVVGPDEVRWHMDLDSDGEAPRTDGANNVRLFLDPDDPELLIEDAAGRFREEWAQRATYAPDGADTQQIHTPDVIAVRLGDIAGAVWVVDGVTVGRLWGPTWSLSIGDPLLPLPAGCGTLVR